VASELRRGALADDMGGRGVQRASVPPVRLVPSDYCLLACPAGH